MPIEGYLDAGGHERQKYIVVAGFISNPKTWADFELSWRSRLKKDGLEYFHAVDFAHSKKQFANGWVGNEDRRKALASDLIDIIKKHVFRKFCNVVINQALTDDMSTPTKKRYYINAYSLAGRTCAARIREWLKEQKWETSLKLTFEKGDFGAGELSRSLVRDGFEAPRYEQKKDSIGSNGEVKLAPTALQAADWFAYEVLLATKKNTTDRWPMKEFLSTPGPMGIYESRDIERLTKFFDTPLDEILTGDLWVDVTKLGIRP